MEIHDHYLAADLCQQGVCFAERIVRVMHKNTALQIDDGIALALPRCSFINANTRNALRKIRRTQNLSRASAGIAIGRVEVIDNRSLAPDVVAGSEHVAAKIE